MTYLLTGLGTLVCRTRDTGALVHRPLTSTLDGVDVLDIGNLTNALQVGLSHFLRDDAEALGLSLIDGPLAGWTIARTEDRRSIHLIRHGQCLLASAETGLCQLAGSDVWPATRYLPMDPADLTILRGLVDGQWLLESAGEATCPEAATLHPGFELRIGTREIDLRWNLPFDRTAWPHRLTVSWDVWKIDRLFRYRPLVYFSAFGNELVMRQFALAIASLVTVGQYAGEIVVLTDKPPAEIAALFPAGVPPKLAILPTLAVDRVGYIAARYAIADWRDAWQFQPLLYTDADVLFDRPVAPMLYAIARTDRICATPEPWHLADSEFVGSHLLADDGCHPPPDAKGFNGGILGIPNMQTHGGTIALIGRTVRNRLAVVGRHSVQFIDQPVANYAAYRTGTFDTEILSRYVRLDRESADPADRTGMVHFCWAVGAALRVEAMRSYLERLHAMG